MKCRTLRTAACAFCAVVVAAGTLLVAQAPQRATSTSPSDRVYLAVRTNDLQQLKTLVTAANVNDRDERGITPLMYASWVGSIDALKMLLDLGANPNLQNVNGSTALALAVTQPDKVRILLERGADANIATKAGRTPLLLAALSDDSAPVVRALLDHGADIHAVDAMKTTGLIAAAEGNDIDTIRMMVDAGLDVNAHDVPFGFTPLIAAAGNGNLAAVRLLLAKGADVNAVSGDGSFNKVKAGTIALGNFTALLMAAPHASPDVIKALLDAGAKVNVQDVRGMTPLMTAVATDHQTIDVVRMIVSKGADVNVKSVAGETALDWAHKIGDPAVVALLKKAGAVATSPSAPTLPPAAPADLRTSAQRGATLLEKTSVTAAANGGCASCHSHNIVDIVSSAASAKGLRIDQKLAADRRQLTRVPYFSPLNVLERMDGPGSPDVPLYALAGLAANGQQPDRVVDAMLANVAAQQLHDGHWKRALGAVARPPIEDGEIFRTAIAISVFKTFAAPGRADYQQRIEHAKQWLASATPFTADDRNWQLIGLECAGADSATIQKLAKAIVARQRPDGGWSQRAELNSDAYATGQTLFALSLTHAVAPTNPAVQKGVTYLLSTQRGDGSWYVRSRSPKFQPFFESGFPYGHDQWISAMATGWATAALTMAIEQPKTEARTDR